MPTAGQVTIGVQSSVGKRRFSRTSAQCPHVGAFRSSFYIFFIFWAEVPPLLNGGILKRLPNTLENTNVFAGKAWEQTYLPIVAHSAVTSTSLNKSNCKRLCRKISLLRNKYDAMITTIFVFKIATVCNNNSFTRNLCCLLDSKVLWRHLAAVRRHKKGSSESSVFTGDALRPEDWGHSGGLWTMTNGCVSVTAVRITGSINNCFIKFPLYLFVIICPFHTIIMLKHVDAHVNHIFWVSAPVCNCYSWTLNN